MLYNQMDYEQVRQSLKRFTEAKEREDLKKVQSIDKLNVGAIMDKTRVSMKQMQFLLDQGMPDVKNDYLLIKPYVVVYEKYDPLQQTTKEEEKKKEAKEEGEKKEDSELEKESQADDGFEKLFIWQDRVNPELFKVQLNEAFAKGSIE